MRGTPGLAFLFVLGACACPPPRACREKQMPDVEVPFTYIAHAIAIPVRVGEIDTRFVLDTGIGINVVTKAISERLGCVVNDEFRGRRMSGQELTVPMTRLPALTVGGTREADVVAGVYDLALPPAFDGI